MGHFTLILLAIYAIIFFGVLAFLAVFFVHIKKYKSLAPHIFVCFRFFLGIICIIAIFGVYKIISAPSTHFSENPFDISTGLRQDF